MEAVARREQALLEGQGTGCQIRREEGHEAERRVEELGFEDQWEATKKGKRVELNFSDWRKVKLVLHEEAHRLSEWSAKFIDEFICEINLIKLNQLE